MKRRLLSILFVVILFCYSLAGLVDYLQDIFHSQNQIRNLGQLIETEEEFPNNLTEPYTDIVENNELPSEPQIQIEFKKLYDQNPDIIGWLTIENTNVNYPVMQDHSGSYYYLNHNFHKQPSIHGLPFLDMNCNIKDSNALLIHGHNMKTGLIFGDLMNFKKESYYKNHPLIRFHTLYENADYEIIAVILSKVYEKAEDAFRYYELESLQTSEGFYFYLDQINKLSLYQIENSASFGDSILILSTCEYSTSNGRLAVIARKVS